MHDLLYGHAKAQGNLSSLVQATEFEEHSRWNTVQDKEKRPAHGSHSGVRELSREQIRQRFAVVKEKQILQLNKKRPLALPLHPNSFNHKNKNLKIEQSKLIDPDQSAAAITSFNSSINDTDNASSRGGLSYGRKLKQQFESRMIEKIQ